jgi:ribosomal protein S18 acetylase RimI-like enzyme
VNPELKGIGIGKTLIEKFEDELKLDGYKYYGLYVRTNNKSAISFYYKLGFDQEFKNFELFSYIKNLSIDKKYNKSYLIPFKNKKI